MPHLRPGSAARSRRPLATTLALALATGMLTLPAQAAFATPSGAPPTGAIDGPQTAGDSVFPNVGNGGYDALNYDVALAWSPDETQNEALLSGSIDAASTTMTARADQPLRSFSLDFEGMQIDSVTVNGEVAQWERIVDPAAIKHKLVITPAEPVSGEFTATVNYHGVPVTHIDTDGSAEGWGRTTDGAILLGQPVGMMAGYPHNNTPGDKATYTFTVDIPSVLAAADGSNPGTAAAVSNGELVSRTPSADGTRTTWVWQQNQRMASELALVGIGRYDILESEITLSDGRRIPSWSFMDSQLPAADKAAVTNRVAQLEEITQNLERVYGPYPGNSTGVVVDSVPSEINYALETQDRSFFPSAGSVAGNTLIHELAHQWFGNNVSPSTWTDIWIAEGMASWMPTHYNSEAGFGARNSTEAVYFASWSVTPEGSEGWNIAPGVQTSSVDIYGYQTYTRSAQFWEALKIAIGDEAFFDLLRQWQDRFAGQSVNGDALKSLAEELSGRDLTALWQDWILTPGKPAWPEKLTASLTGPTNAAPAGRGDELSFTLTASNTGLVPLATSVVTVDVASLLGSADLSEPLPAGLTLSDATLSWAIPATDPGATATVSFGAQVKNTASGGTIDASARVATLGGTCSECSASIAVREDLLSPAPAPTIAGKTQVGETLTAHAEGWPADTSFAYEWAISETPVAGATGATFVLPESAVGKAVTVTVTGTKPGFLATPVTSAPTAKVQAKQTDPKPDPQTDSGETAPTQPTLADLTDALKGKITLPAVAKPGERITVGIHSERAGEKLEAWLFSVPRHLATETVSAQGSIGLTIPADVALGEHKLVIANSDGSVIGWAPITIEAASTGGASPLAASGAPLPARGGAFGALLLLGGAVAFAARRRSHNRV
ncbi:hypothetical protein ACI1US_00148 [Leucobacter sp. BZR 635]